MQLKAAAESHRAAVQAAEQGARAAAEERDVARQELDTANNTLTLLKEEVGSLNTSLEQWAEEGLCFEQTISDLKARVEAGPAKSAAEEAASGEDAAHLKKQLGENQRLLALAQSEVKQAKKTAKNALIKAQAEDAASRQLKEEINTLKEQLASSEEAAGWSLEEDPRGDASGAKAEELAALQEELATLRSELDEAKKERDQANEALAAASESRSAPAREPSAETFSSDKTAAIWSAPRSAATPKKEAVNPFDSDELRPQG